MDPKVSVVISTYNHASFIAESIDSVLAQTYRDFEVIVIDDGSTDNTEEVLKPYLDRIRLIKQENSGLPVARNAGIKEAKGEYIAFQDSDDIWLPDKLEKQMKYLEKNPHFDLVCGNGISFGNEGNTERLLVRNKRLRAIEKEGVTLKNTYRKSRLFPSTWVIKKKVLEELGGFDTIFRTGQDVEFTYRFLLKHKAAFINEVLFKRRTHSTNISRVNSEPKILLAIRITEKLMSQYPDARMIIGNKLINRKMSSLHYKLGRVYYKNNRKNQACDSFKKALSYSALHSSSVFYYFLCKWCRLYDQSQLRKP